MELMNSRSIRTLDVCLVALSIVVPCRLAAADAITLAWNPATDQIAGYKLYVGTQSGTYTQSFDVGPAATYTFTNAVAGQRYCFAVAAYSSRSIESPKSNEVCGFSNSPPSLTNPGNQSSTVGQPTSLQLTGSDPEGQPLTYSATGLPPGLSLMVSTGYISGSGNTAGSYECERHRVRRRRPLVVAGVHMGDRLADVSAAALVRHRPHRRIAAIDRSMRDQVRLSWTTASWTQACGCIETAP